MVLHNAKILISIAISFIFDKLEKCDEKRCEDWSRINAIMLTFGSFMTIIGFTEALLKDGRNFRSIFSETFWVRSISEAAFRTRHHKSFVDPSFTQNDIEKGKEYFVETTDDIVHGDIRNASYSRLIRESYNHQDVMSTHFRRSEKFEMKFPYMTYNNLSHLFYFTTDRSAFVGLNWARAIEFMNNEIYVLQTYELENIRCLKSADEFPVKVGIGYRFA